MLDSVGKNIKKFRLGKKLRQEDLAEKTGLSSNYIGMVERGEKIPSLETFISIINALGVSADMVLSEVTNCGYKIKNTVLDEKMSTISIAEKNRIYDVIETLLRHAK